LSDDDLQPLGIRRWRLQKVLFEAVLAKGIPVHFNKKVCGVTTASPGGEEITTVHFCDGKSLTAQLLLAADGANSLIRSAVAGHLATLKYTGTTCLYGCATVAREARGICFPSSETTKCHGCFYPVSANEQCFQFHIPTPPKSKEEGGWGTLFGSVGEEECRKLAERLQKDGWDAKYLQPLYHAKKAIKVPFALLEPHLQSFVFNRRIVLVGDSAHPPVPYLGQGAQQGLEDAGTLALLLQQLCTNGGQGFSLDHIDSALQVYNRMRVPRTAEIIQKSKGMGFMQQKRADNKRYNEVKEELIRRDVFFHETMSVILPGTTYNYKEDVAAVLQDEPLVPVPEEEEDISTC
jgi:salicylate hydroxylase